jgi:hypothetical protein
MLVNKTQSLWYFVTILVRNVPWRLSVLPGVQLGKSLFLSWTQMGEFSLQVVSGSVAKNTSLEFLYHSLAV